MMHLAQLIGVSAAGLWAIGAVVDLVRVLRRTTRENNAVRTGAPVPLPNGTSAVDRTHAKVVT